MAGFIERIVAVADTADYGMKSKIAAAQAPSANFSRPIAAIVARSEITIGMDVGTVNTRLHAAAVPLEQRIEVKTALVRAGWLPRAEAPGTVHAGQGGHAHAAEGRADCCNARSSPRHQPGKALSLANVDTALAAANLTMQERLAVKTALRSAGQIES